jgi:hypothetical protein
VQEIVKIHGNWCGPDWTARQRKPAKDLTLQDRDVPCTDKLDCACKVHDIDVYERGGRTRGSDTRLSNVAIRIAYDFRQPRALRRKALLVAYGMLIGRTR